MMTDFSKGFHIKAAKESGRFLKKAAQKLLLCWATGNVGDNAHNPE
jgi:hypothetical protein